MLQRRLPGRLLSLRRLSGGASQETWALDAAPDAGGGGAAEPLILRRRPGGDAATEGAMTIGLEVEAQVLEAARGAGVPVPAVRLVLEPGDGLGSGYLMERLEGETIPRRILRDEAFARARPRLARQCGEALARIHAVPSRVLPPLPEAPAGTQWKLFRDVYEGTGHPRPVFELAFRWLADHLPEPGPATLVHGDFRHGNLLVDGEGLRGVLDWEMAHTGDPHEDLGWICVGSWRFGNIDLPVGGFGRREELFAGYEAGGGRRVDPDRVRFWEILGTLKWGIMCTMMLGVFESGTDRSVERAAIGRRASETELDLLELLCPED